MNNLGKLLKMVEHIEPTENQEWGFWGTVKSNFDLTTTMTHTVWDYMGDVLVKKGVHDPREFLDSKWGRHLADELTYYCNKKEDVNALKKGIDSWNKEPKSKWVLHSKP